MKSATVLGAEKMRQVVGDDCWLTKAAAATVEGATVTVTTAGCNDSRAGSSHWPFMCSFNKNYSKTREDDFALNQALTDECMYIYSYLRECCKIKDTQQQQHEYQ